MKQGTTIVAKRSFMFRKREKGARFVKVAKGQRFWITTTETQMRTEFTARIEREGKGHIGTGWLWPVEALKTEFEVLTER